ncbi:hypothetical protein B1A99_25115 [Cohnella sp. CIP 111063]|uniref:hypothetical protein n=1 Tax=unclassified Cohnella TaxID=2636738 RepID=UPI000B8C2598|nr:MULTISPECIES: hypothetical protein [unclassified Cohnella]OXS55061.1 hypothetical protein B1A99_25115 [Cohnella sp. CIP 111063]PRX65198.1 hypothetical protein B0G52_118151 [Cohnella sp. SGD-V74]
MINGSDNEKFSASLRNVAGRITSSLVDKIFSPFLLGQVNLDTYISSVEGYTFIQEHFERNWPLSSHFEMSKQDTFRTIKKMVEDGLENRIVQILHVKLSTLLDQYRIALVEQKALTEDLKTNTVQLDILHKIHDVHTEMLEYAETIARIKIYLQAKNRLSELENENGTKEISYDYQTTSDDWQGKLYVFQRKIEGGNVDVADGIGYISERWVRAMGLEDGDIVRPIKRIPLQEGIGFRYEFNLVEKRKCKQPFQRELLSKCRISTNNVVEFYENGQEIILNNKKETFLLSNNEMKRKDLKPGDIIDIAFPSGKPHKYKVVWKYE